MDGFFFARIDYDDKNKRLMDKTMEMVWQSSESLGAAADIFTGVLYYFYGPPPGFCFDIRCDDSVPIQVCFTTRFYACANVLCVCISINQPLCTQKDTKRF